MVINGLGYFGIPLTIKKLRNSGYSFKFSEYADAKSPDIEVAYLTSILLRHFVSDYFYRITFST